jgi:hypothetical protein
LSLPSRRSREIQMTEETEVIAVELDLDTTVAMLLRGMAEGDEISLHFPGVDGGIKVQRSSEVAQALVGIS